jgi:hypothetical protein
MITAVIAMINAAIAIILGFTLQSRIEKRLGHKLVFPNTLSYRISSYYGGHAGEITTYIFFKFFREKVFRRPPGKIKWLADNALDLVNYQLDKDSRYEVFVTLFGDFNIWWFFIVAGLLYFHIINFSFLQTKTSVASYQEVQLKADIPSEELTSEPQQTNALSSPMLRVYVDPNEASTLKNNDINSRLKTREPELFGPIPENTKPYINDIKK